MQILKSRIFFPTVAVIFSLLMVISVPSEAGWLDRAWNKVEKVFGKIEKGLGKASKIQTLINIAKEAKQKKRNEAALNKRASQERQTGKSKADAIRNRAYERYNERDSKKKISAREMMSEFERANRVEEYYGNRAECLGVLARRQGRLHLEKKIIPIAISKVAKTQRLQNTMRKIETAFKNFDGDIGTLITKAAELKMGIEGKQADIVSKAKSYFDKFAKVNNKIVEIQRTMKDLGIRDKKLERLLEKIQVTAYDSAQIARGVAETGYESGERLKKVLAEATKQLEVAKSELDKRRKEISSFADKAAKMKPHARPVDPVERIVANDPDYQEAKATEKFLEAFYKKNEYVDPLERELAIEKRLKNLQDRWKKSSDAEERKLIEYQMSLLNKRLKGYKTEDDKEEEKETKIKCGPNEELNSQGVCVCKSGFESVSGKCLPKCGADERRDEQGRCVCITGYERVKGICLPPCGQNEMRDASGNCICKSGYERQNGECVLIVKKEEGKDFQKIYTERENRRSDKVTKQREIDIYDDWYRGDSDDSDEEMRRRLTQGLKEMEKTVEPQHVKEPKEQKDEGTKKPQVSEETKWYVWHNCGDNVGWWCHLHLSKKTKDFLNDKNNRALVGPSESEEQARQSICGMMDKSTFYEKGQGGAGVDTGTIVKIGGKVYDVTPFVYWDSNAEMYKCK